MNKTALKIRCVPRYGFANTEVRTVDLEVSRDAEPEVLEQMLNLYFATRGIADAVYAIEADDNGFFAVINDEAYGASWGTALL